MTSKERFNAAAERRKPDRVPIELRFCAEIEKRLIHDLRFEGRKQLLDWIGQDSYTIRPVFKNPASPIKYADPTIRVEGKLYYDIYGVPFTEVKNAYQVNLEFSNIAPLKNADSRKIWFHIRGPSRTSGITR
jgi:hypothetical protein